MTDTSNAALIVAQRIHEARSLSGFAPQEIAAGTALHERQVEIRAAYQRVVQREVEGAPLPLVNDNVRRILKVMVEAERNGHNGRDMLELIPSDATRDDFNTAFAFMTTRSMNARSELDDMKEVREAVRPFFHDKPTLKDAFASWEAAQRPEATPGG